MQKACTNSLIFRDYRSIVYHSRLLQAFFCRDFSSAKLWVRESWRLQPPFVASLYHVAISEIIQWSCEIRIYALLEVYHSMIYECTSRWWLSTGEFTGEIYFTPHWQSWEILSWNNLITSLSCFGSGGIPHSALRVFSFNMTISSRWDAIRSTSESRQALWAAIYSQVCLTFSRSIKYCVKAELCF